MDKQLALASKSPRRRELLQQMGLEFEVLSVDVCEKQSVAELPHRYVERVARDKAVAGGKVCGDLWVLSADTAVVLDDRIMGKPGSKEDACEMLSCLSGQWHNVLTGVVLLKDNYCESLVVSTEVCFRNISEQEIDNYWLTGEPVDKAGAYGIQGYGGVFVQEIRGSYSNVVGLPLMETHAMLQTVGLGPAWNTTLVNR